MSPLTPPYRGPAVHGCSRRPRIPLCRGWLFALWSTSPCCGWAFRVVVNPAVGCLGCSHCRWAHCAMLGVFTLSFCPLCCLRALRVVVEPAVLLLGPSRCRWALLVVVGSFASSSGSPCRGWALHIVVWPAPLSFGPAAACICGGVHGLVGKVLWSWCIRDCVGSQFGA